MRTLADPSLGEEIELPTHRLADGPLPPETACQLVHDDLMLDGNARLNLARFVTTFMEQPRGLALRRRWSNRRGATGEPAGRRHLVMGANVQVC